MRVLYISIVRSSLLHSACALGASAGLYPPRFGAKKLCSPLAWQGGSAGSRRPRGVCARGKDRAGQATQGQGQHAHRHRNITSSHRTTVAPLRCAPLRVHALYLSLTASRAGRVAESRLALALEPRRAPVPGRPGYKRALHRAATPSISSARRLPSGIPLCYRILHWMPSHVLELMGNLSFPTRSLSALQLSRTLSTFATPADVVAPFPERSRSLVWYAKST